jgi:putative endonuclease
MFWCIAMVNWQPAKFSTPTNKQLKGAVTEGLACEYLCQQGLVLLDQNFSCKVGEIDLIMQDQEQWVFVEVRSRTSSRFGGALASVDRTKLVKLQRAIQWYLQSRFGRHSNRWPPCRIDVVAVNADQVQWVKNVLS